ncbi:glycerol-3-phosphate phosphatase [Drosophila sulfurigaster albostrigata]|uniref:glycerol-3-phosphate phosphatase n=1 Tax=Drosophila sulfurigaster albostrigata TaxID=89887 RepID=UPI002D21A348|nr:glycerol-3-phosphate phosphatase [Drosophila sulfurigaster albostrigata]
MCAAMTNILVKKGVCQLLALNKFSIQQWLKCIDTIVFDADGVLWHREDVIEGTPETFNALRAMGKQVFICTNHSAMSANGLCNKAQKMGFLIGANEILSSSMALARYLQERKFKRKVFIVGEQGIADELKAVGIESLPIKKEQMLGSSLQDHVQQMQLDDNVGAVAVGIDSQLNMLKMCEACCYLKDRRILFLATNRDRAFPASPGRMTPGAGVMVSAIQAASKRVPFTCGKPNTFICSHLIREGIINPERTLMVGDTMYTDIHFGYNCGFQTLLVGTGVNNLQDVAAAQKSSKPMQYQQIPDLFVPKLSDLLKFLPSRNG